LVRFAAAVGLHVTTGTPAYDRPRSWHLAIARAPRSQLRHALLDNDRPESTWDNLDHIYTRITSRHHGHDSQHLCLLDALRLVSSLATTRLPIEGSVIRHLYD
jgi:hypothetical protein